MSNTMQQAYQTIREELAPTGGASSPLFEHFFNALCRENIPAAAARKILIGITKPSLRNEEAAVYLMTEAIIYLKSKGYTIQYLVYTDIKGRAGIIIAIQKVYRPKVFAILWPSQVSPSNNKDFSSPSQWIEEI